MKSAILWVGVTDKDWFDYLADLQPDEVNFWQPSARPPTHQLGPGDLFLFKLHSPLNFVVGGGFYVRFAALPARIAWEAFENRNGVSTLPELLARLKKYRRSAAGDVEIGCNVLNAPFFFRRKDWIPIPEDWAKNIVRGKTYTVDSEVGRNLYNDVRERIITSYPRAGHPPLDNNDAFYLTKARLGQGAFRVLVTDAYHRRCAVTGERTLPVLEAAHIRAHAAGGPNKVNNGMLLWADIHRLFDSGYVTVDPQFRFVVSENVRQDYENGREYYMFHGRRLINLPDTDNDYPTRDFIDWHNAEVYVG